MLGKTNCEAILAGGGKYSSCRKISYGGSGTSQYAHHVNLTGPGFIASTTSDGGYIEFTTTENMSRIICTGNNGGGGYSAILIDFATQKAYIADNAGFYEVNYSIMVPAYTGTYAKITKSSTSYGGPPNSPIKSNFDGGTVMVFF